MGKALLGTGTGDPAAWHPADLGSFHREFMGVSKKHNGTISYLITSVTKATEESRVGMEAPRRSPGLLGK